MPNTENPTEDPILPEENGSTPEIPQEDPTLSEEPLIEEPVPAPDPEEPKYSRRALERMNEFRPYVPIIRVLIHRDDMLTKTETWIIINGFLTAPV